MPEPRQVTAATRSASQKILLGLVDDPGVGLQAMSALRQVVENAAAVSVLERVSSVHLNQPLGEAATRQLRKARKSLAR